MPTRAGRSIGATNRDCLQGVFQGEMHAKVYGPFAYPIVIFGIDIVIPDIDIAISISRDLVERLGAVQNTAVNKRLGGG